MQHPPTRREAMNNKQDSHFLGLKELLFLCLLWPKLEQAPGSLWAITWGTAQPPVAASFLPSVMPGFNELHEEYYYECSIASTNETADNLPGHGRLLGNLYVSLGRHLEYGIGTIAGKMGFGPKAIASKIKRLRENDVSLFNPTKYRKLEKYCKQTARYLRWVTVNHQWAQLESHHDIVRMSYLIKNRHSIISSTLV